MSDVKRWRFSHVTCGLLPLRRKLRRACKTLMYLCGWYSLRYLRLCVSGMKSHSLLAERVVVDHIKSPAERLGLCICESDCNGKPPYIRQDKLRADFVFAPTCSDKARPRGEQFSDSLVDRFRRSVIELKEASARRGTP
jgi:hypothetical protein